MPSVSKKQHNLMAAVANNPKFAKQVGIKQSVGEDFMKADKGRKFAKGGVTRHEDEAMDKKMIKKAVGMHDKQLHGGKKTDLAKLKKGGKVKKYEDGGLTFADMPEEDRASQARAAMDAINARQAAASEAAGGASAVKPMPRRAQAPSVSRSYRDEGSQGVAKMAANPAVVGSSKPKSAISDLASTLNRPLTKVEKYKEPNRQPQKQEGKPKGALRDLYDTMTSGPRLLKKGGSVSGASKRADGCATKGKTKGTMVKMCGGGYAKKGK